MSLNTPLRNFDLDTELVNIYTTGGCKILAVLLMRVLEGGELCAVIVNDDPKEYIHFVVKIGDRYVDAQGIWSERALLNFWTSELVEDGISLSLASMKDKSFARDRMFRRLDMTLNNGSLTKRIIDEILPNLEPIDYMNLGQNMN